MIGVVTTLTERGQISVPSSLRRKLGLRAGQPLVWRQVSNHEVRLTVPRKGTGQSMRGFMKKFVGQGPVRTAAWMKILREGEVA